MELNDNSYFLSNIIREQYTLLNVIGDGRFGVVHCARDKTNNEIVAIKHVCHNKLYVNKEIEVLKVLNHPNIIKLYKHVTSQSEQNEHVCYHLVMEYFPQCLSNILRELYQKKKQMEMIYVKLYSFQLLKAISYLHALDICHRDIKPQNILVNNKSNVIKLCDFNSARKIKENDDKMYPYICTRFYRAPELIFGCTKYSLQVDMWSAGCVIAELVLARPVFPGESDSDQLVEIIKQLGAPTKEQIILMNPDYINKVVPVFPERKGKEWKHVFRRNKNVNEEFIDLISKILIYEPNKRLTPLQAMCHSFYDELKDSKTKLPNGDDIPNDLFCFTKEEIDRDKELVNIILNSLH